MRTSDWVVLGIVVLTLVCTYFALRSDAKERRWR